MTDVYAAALSGIKTTKREMSLNAHNIANANTEGYTRLFLEKSANVVGDQVAGVDISAIKTLLDDNLQTNLYSRISKDSYEGTIKNYYQRMHEEMGTPGEGNSLDSLLNSMYTSFEKLAASPTSASQKLMTLNEIKDFSNKISKLAQSFEGLRFEIDQEVYKSVQSLNSELQNSYRLNSSFSAFQKGSLEYVQTEDDFRKSIEKISEYLDTTKYIDSNGATKIFTAGGISLVGDSEYFLKYEPQQSVYDLVNDEEFNQITLSYNNPDGVDQKLDRVLFSGGRSSEIETKVKYGKFAALMNLRDKEIPKALAQLDALAKAMKEEVNRIHNDGVSVNPPTNISGTTQVSRDQKFGFTGKTRFTIVDDSAQPIANLPSLDLDLSNLDTGDGIGKANLQGILKEIDYHFGQRLSSQNKVSVGNIADIKLASVSSTIAPSSTFDLDLELWNRSDKNATFQILSATATDNTAANILGSFNGAISNAAIGSTVRTTTSGASVRINTPATLNYPFTVTLDVRVNDGVSNYDSTVTFTVDAPTVDTFNGVKNSRFNPTNVTGAGTLTAPSFATPILSTRLVNSSGEIIAANSTDKGLIQIIANNQSYHIAIDNLDSSQTGIISEGMLGTNESFSYYFGLNDLFVRTDKAEDWGSTKNTAFYFGIRGDIQDEPSMISTAKLKTTMDFSSPNTTQYTYEIAQGDISNLIDLANLKNKRLFFASAGTLPATTVSTTDYASEILGFNTTQYAIFSSRANEAQMSRKSLAEKIQNIKGVDVNEELTNMILYQQAFTANARLINAAKEMDQILLDLFR